MQHKRLHSSVNRYHTNTKQPFVNTKRHTIYGALYNNVIHQKRGKMRYGSKPGFSVRSNQVKARLANTSQNTIILLLQSWINNPPTAGTIILKSTNIFYGHSKCPIFQNKIDYFSREKLAYKHKRSTTVHSDARTRYNTHILPHLPTTTTLSHTQAESTENKALAIATQSTDQRHSNQPNNNNNNDRGNI